MTQSCHDHESLPGPERISLHGVIFMLRKVESTSDVNRGPEPCQCGPALTFSSFLPLPRSSQCLSYRAVHVYACDDHYLVCSKFNSLLTEMITPQTYKNIY